LTKNILAFWNGGSKKIYSRYKTIVKPLDIRTEQQEIITKCPKEQLYMQIITRDTKHLALYHPIKAIRHSTELPIGKHNML
jgi:hypothetical protein